MGRTHLNWLSFWALGFILICARYKIWGARFFSLSRCALQVQLYKLFYQGLCDVNRSAIEASKRCDFVSPPRLDFFYVRLCLKAQQYCGFKHLACDVNAQRASNGGTFSIQPCSDFNSSTWCAIFVSTAVFERSVCLKCIEGKHLRTSQPCVLALMRSGKPAVVCFRTRSGKNTGCLKKNTAACLRTRSEKITPVDINGYPRAVVEIHNQLEGSFETVQWTRKKI